MLIDIFLTLLTVVFSLIVVFSKRTVVSALSLLVTLVLVGIIYFQLGAIFLAAVQVLINAGAIAILFVFVMMLVNVDILTPLSFNQEVFVNKANLLKNKSKLIISIIVLLIAFGVLSLMISSTSDSLKFLENTDFNMKLLFAKLFDVYFVPFELATMLLLAAIVAVIIIAEKEKSQTSECIEDVETKR